MAADVETLRTVADYQWGAGAGEALFPEDEREALRIERTSSGRPQQVHSPTGRLVSYGVDGRFTLGFAGGRRLQSRLARPRYRVAVGDDSEPFVRDGRNAFAKFISRVDPDVRPGDEVLVVHERGPDRGSDRPAGDLLAVGRAELPAEAMRAFDTGVAVKVREGADE